MTDKQIIERLKTDLDFERTKRKTLQAELKAKEQECEELKEYFEIAKEASNCNLKALGEMTEWADKLDEENDQLKEQLEAYKMEAEEGKEINAELKAELARANCQIADDEILQCDMREAIEELKAEKEELKEILNEGCLHNLTLMTEQRVLLQTLAEIKKLVEKARENLYTCESIGYADDELRTILQKISECEVGNEL